MTNLYRITPLEKKSVEAFYDVYQEMSNGSIRSWSVTETWRWGQGFRELEDIPMSHECDPEKMLGVHCQPGIGWGCELDDLCATWFEFDDSFSEEEQQLIKDHWHGDIEDSEGRWGAAWLFDGDHNWQVEDDHIRILPPLKIDLVNEDVYNECIEENVQPKVFDPKTSWPFSPDFPDTSK